MLAVGLSLAAFSAVAVAQTAEGDDAVAEEAAPEFTAVVSGGFHNCGIHGDGAVACWGENGWGQADAADGQFDMVTAGVGHTCGLRKTLAISCWGNDIQGQASAPSGQFRAVAAGAYHSCAIRVSDDIVCWGSNHSGQAAARSGTYTDVAAGSGHSCGLRSDATIVCWGDDTHGQADAPEGEFVGLTAGAAFSCGLRSDATVTCWGANSSGQADAPRGEFTTVTGGLWHACGLRADATTLCWGNDTHGQADAPEGEFIDVSAGSFHSCGLRSDATITCWGGENLAARSPRGTFTAVSGGSEHSCGLGTDATVTCWGRGASGRISTRHGEYSAVSAGIWHSCGVRTDGTIACWGNNAHGQADAPEGEFTDVSAGWMHSCGLRADATAACWGDNSHGQIDAPDGRFTAVAARGTHSCGLRSDASITCWGDNTYGQARAPDGRFAAVSVAFGHSCGLRETGTITCWGGNWSGQSNPPEGRFSAVAAGLRHSCGLLAGGTIACWGYDGGLADPPEGSFSAVAAGNRHSCGLRTDGAIVCWHLAPTVALPTGVGHFSGADPGNCRPHGIRDVVSAGFPLPRRAIGGDGTALVAVLFVDFPDAVANHSTAREAELGLPIAEQYLESSSYGKLDIEFVTLDRWLRAEQNRNATQGESGATAQEAVRDIPEMAVRQADPEFDFTGYDSVMIVMPSSEFGGGNASRGVDTDEGRVPTHTRINVFADNDRSSLPEPWGRVGIHELLHNFGLPDLYAGDGSHELPDAPGGRVWVNASFGPMGFGGRFLTLAGDPRLAHTVNYRDGSHAWAYSHSLIALEMLAWHRWQLGWLAPEQVRCMTDPAATVSLRPIAEPGDGIAMVAIPLSDTELIVVESRRKIGYDAGWHYRWANGETTLLPGLDTEGLLVYTVDTRRATTRLPLGLVGDSGNGQVDEYPILTVGESVTTHGYTITLQTASDETHTVAIIKDDEPETEAAGDAEPIEAEVGTGTVPVEDA